MGRQQTFVGFAARLPNMDLKEPGHSAIQTQPAHIWVLFFFVGNQNFPDELDSWQNIRELFVRQ
jgi:hypothetical protein